MMARFSKTQRIALLLILLLAFFLRIYRLGIDSLWYDETVSALLASKPLVAMWKHTAGDIHPPLYYGLLRGWTAAVGHDEFSLAFFSLWFGVATIPLIGYLALRLYGPRAGVLAAFLVAVNPFSIWYAQEVRMYTLGMFLLVLVLLFALDYMQGSGRGGSRTLALYAVFSSLALWTVYYSAFALIALNLFVILWLGLRDRRRLLNWLLAQVLVLVLYLPWLANALRQAFDPPVPPWRDPVPFGDLLLEVGRQGVTALAFGQSLDPRQWWWFGLVGLLLAAIAVWVMPRRWDAASRWWASSLLWVTLLVPVILIVVFSELLSPLYHVRYLILYSAAYPVLVAVGMLHVAGWDDHGKGREERLAGKVSASWRWAVSGLLLLILLAGTFISLRNYHSDRFAYESADDLRGAVKYLYDRMGPRDAVLVNAGYLYPAFLAYWPGEIGWLGRLSDYPPADQEVGAGPLVVLTGHVDGDPNLGWGDPDSDFYAISKDDTADRLAALFADTNTVWHLRGYDTVNDPTGFVRGWLETNGDLYLDQVFAGQTFVRDQAWRTTRAPRHDLTIDHLINADFVGGIRLLGYDISSVYLQEGEPMRLTLYWQRTGEIDRSYKIFTQLLAGAQDVVAQDDALPLQGAYPTDQWQPGELVESTFVLPLPQHLPAGDYTLITGFYDEETGERLPLLEGDDAFTLRTFNHDPQ